MWLLGTLFYDCFCQQSTCRRRCEGSIHACFMVFTRCTQVGTRVSSRTCISSILPAGPSQVRASAAPAPPQPPRKPGGFSVIPASVLGGASLGSLCELLALSDL